MKNAILFSALLLQCLFGKAQTFDVEAIVNNGDINQHINFVILSDGYRASELSKFVTDASNFTNALFNTSPYKQYKNYFNVYLIKVPSNESGATHPGTATDVSEPAHPVSVVDNYFGSAFDRYGIHRLLVPTKSGNIINVLANNFPSYDQVIILVNSPHYGGSGGTYATASLHPSSSEIAIHELGHSFAKLKDEYWAGDVYAAEGINMTQTTNASLVRWKNWYNDNGVGIYQHCCGGSSSNWYKPHQGCKMQVLGSPLCSVCTEGIIEKTHALTNPILSHTPTNTNISVTSSSPLAFQLNIIAPIPNTLNINWKLNNVNIGTNSNSIQIAVDALQSGSNNLTVVVRDNTSLLRVDNHAQTHSYSVSWTIENTQTPGAFPDPNKWYVIKNKDSGLNIRNDDCNTALQTYVELYNSTNACAQWRFIKTGNNWIIQNRASGLNMRNDDCKSVSGQTLIELWNGTGSCAQWKLIPSPETAYYHLRNVSSNLNIRNEDCNNALQTRVELHTGTGDCTQWQFIPVDDIASKTRIASGAFDLNKAGTELQEEMAAAPNPEPVSIRLYPNPSYTTLHVNYGGQGLETVTLTDLNGRILLHKEVSSVQETTLDVQGVPEGLYLVKLAGAKGEVVKRVILAED